MVRRRWLDERAYADLVGLCQFLPGPAISQVGFSIGLMRAGWRGALAAWTGFTLPSAVILVLFAYGAGALGGPIGAGLLHGLKLVAVAIVAQAVLGMARTLCPDRERASIAVVASLIMLFTTNSVAQVATIVLGGIAGLWLCPTAAPPSGGHVAVPVSRQTGLLSLATFFLILLGLPVVRGLVTAPVLTLFEAFYRSGALVFGGGHVVLPLLRVALVPHGWLSDDAFLTGYGLAQAVPGPLFTVAAYLGAVAAVPSPAAGAAVAVVCIFLPGLLLAVAGLSLWSRLAGHERFGAAMTGINAAVVGILAAALYDPVWTSTVRDGVDVAVAAGALLLLQGGRAPPLATVFLCAACSVVRVLL